jgi:hypothetical protein
MQEVSWASALPPGFRAGDFVAFHLRDSAGGVWWVLSACTWAR